jgi:lipopolysaccharide export LptBFGC system permease protein LptF
VNRIFRSALFPLIVIVLLVYLASQTLIPSGEESEKVTYSQLVGQAENGNVQEVLFTSAATR